MRLAAAKKTPFVLLVALFVLTLFLGALEGSGTFSKLSLGRIINQWPMGLMAIGAPLFFAIVRTAKLPLDKGWLTGFYTAFILILLVDALWADALIRHGALGEAGAIWLSAPFLAVFFGFGAMGVRSLGSAFLKMAKR